jgi:hypothetical protein
VKFRVSTLAAEMRAFDKLSPEVRRQLHDAPINLSAVTLAKAARDHRLSPSQTAGMIASWKSEFHAMPRTERGWPTDEVAP